MTNYGRHGTGTYMFAPSQEVVISGPHALEGMRAMVRWTTDSAMGSIVCVWVYALNRTVSVPPHVLSTYAPRHDSRRAEGWNTAVLP